MKMKYLVYFNGGDTYLFNKDVTKGELRAVKERAREAGQIGYLSGYRYFDNARDSVWCFFAEQPSDGEIAKRRANGFLGAKWNRLN
jgi:hypothetical protein